MSRRTFIIILVLLAVFGLGVGADLTLIHLRQITQPGFRSFCSWSATVNCDAVARSTWAEVAGVPISFLGVLYYLFVLLLAGCAAAEVTAPGEVAVVLFVLSGLSVLYSALLAYVSYGVLNVICILCSGLYAVNALTFVLSWTYLRSPLSGIASFVRSVREALAQRPARSLIRAAVLIPFVAAAAGFGLWTQSLRQKATALTEGKSVVTLGPTEMDLLAPDLAGPGSQLTIIEFADFECPYCREFSFALHDVLRPLGDRVRMIFKNYPLDPSCNDTVAARVHPHACALAVAAQCAGRQGKFWPYYDLLFRNQYAQDPPSLMSYAMRIGLDVDAFKECLRDPVVLEAVKADIALGMKLGVTGVPAVIIKDTLYLGALSPEKLRSVIAGNLR